MGDIADGMIDGTFDYITGEYLGEGGGFPRTRYQGGKKSKSSENFTFEQLARKRVIDLKALRKIRSVKYRHTGTLEGVPQDVIVEVYEVEQAFVLYKPSYLEGKYNKGGKALRPLRKVVFRKHFTKE